MGLEIERKFLLKDDSWRQEIKESIEIKQGYLNSNKERTVRIRLKNKKGILTIKGKNKGLTRKEFEYEIPYNEAIDLISLCEQPIIEKTRYIVIDGPFIWEIDEFDGDNKGLKVAEVELKSENDKIELPKWVGEEVSNDPKYFNSSLIKHPYKSW